MEQKLKYPILLVHGMGFRDDKRIDYWGRIPSALEAMGCRVYRSNQDCNGEIEENSLFLARRIEEILEETGAEKVNIIAHSKGGLDSRYAISKCGIGHRVASLTTLASPHHGSKTIDFLLKFPDFMVRFCGWCFDRWCRLIGDDKPHSYGVFHSLTTRSAAEFNRNVPNLGSVYYQSYAFVMRRPTDDPGMFLPNLLVGMIEGENDGLLSPEAVRWGDFRGIVRGAGRQGVSHLDEIDLWKTDLSVRIGKEEMTLLELYREIVRELARKGF